MTWTLLDFVLIAYGVYGGMLLKDFLVICTGPTKQWEINLQFAMFIFCMLYIWSYN